MTVDLGVYTYVLDHVLVVARRRWLSPIPEELQSHNRGYVEECVAAKVVIGIGSLARAELACIGAIPKYGALSCQGQQTACGAPKKMETPRSYGVVRMEKGKKAKKGKRPATLSLPFSHSRLLPSPLGCWLRHTYLLSRHYNTT